MIGGLGALGGAGGGGEDVDVDVETEVNPDVDESGTIPEPEPVTSVDVETEVGPEAPYGVNPNTGEPLPPPRGEQSAINPARGSQKGGGKLMQLARRGR
jgi:hypothetical protein